MKIDPMLNFEIERTRTMRSVWIGARARIVSAAFAAALAVVAVSARAEDPSLYDQLGGATGVRELMREALTLSARNPINAEQLRGVDLDKLAASLDNQVCSLTGGGCQYSGKSMRESHKGLGVTTPQFNALVEDLQIAMDRRAIPYRTQNRLLSILAPMHRDIVQR